MQNMILEIPRLGDLFQFTDANVSFVLLCITLIVGIWLCFGGYRYFKFMTFALVGCLCGRIGYAWGTQSARTPIFQMYIFVTCILVGIGVLYLLSLIWEAYLQKDNKKLVLRKIMVVVSPMIGSFVLGSLIYTRIYRDVTVAIVVMLVFMISGIFWGRKNYENRRKFYTYDDLINMK